MNIIIRQMSIKDDWLFLADKLKLKRVDDTCGFIAESKGKIVGAVVYDNFLRNSAQASIYAENPFVFRSDLLTNALEFAFDKCGLEYLYVMVSQDNTPSLRLSSKLGFKEVFRMPGAFREGVDYIVKRMHKDECDYYHWG